MSKRHIGKKTIRTRFIDREDLLMPVQNDVEPEMDAEATRVVWSELDAAEERGAATEHALTQMGIAADR